MNQFFSNNNDNFTETNTMESSGINIIIIEYNNEHDDDNSFYSISFSSHTQRHTLSLFN